MFETCRGKKTDKLQSMASKGHLESHWAYIKPQDTIDFSQMTCVYEQEGRCF